MLLWIGLAIVIVAALIYFFARSGTSTPAATSSKNATLVSTNTGTAQGIKSSNTTTAGSPVSSGDQIVSILRNVSSIQLNDALFQNPAFATLTDLSIALPAVTTQGRRNPFAPAGTDTTAYVAPATATQGQSASSQAPAGGSAGANAPSGGSGF